MNLISHNIVTLAQANAQAVGCLLQNFGFQPHITEANLKAAVDQYGSHFSTQLLSIIAPGEAGFNAGDEMGPPPPPWSTTNNGVTTVGTPSTSGSGWTNFINGLNSLLGAVDKSADVYGKIVDPRNPNPASGGSGGNTTTVPVGEQPDAGKTNWLIYAAIGAVVLLILVVIILKKK